MLHPLKKRLRLTIFFSVSNSLDWTEVYLEKTQFKAQIVHLFTLYHCYPWLAILLTPGGGPPHPLLLLDENLIIVTVCGLYNHHYVFKMIKLFHNLAVQYLT